MSDTTSEDQGDRSISVVIRGPNHLGELVLALPALRRAGRRWRERPLVQLPLRLAPVVAMSGAAVDVLPMEGRHRFLRNARSVRARSPDTGVLLTPSFSAALLLALCGVARRRGTDTDGRGWLLTDPVDREPLLRGHRVREYLVLVEGAAPARSDAGGGTAGDEGQLPRPRLERLSSAREAWRSTADRLSIPDPRDGGDVAVGLIPGSRAPARRWPAARWRELAGRLLQRDVRVMVFGAPGEERLTRRVAGGRPGAVDLGGRTDLFALVGALEASAAVVANDTGSMHLAAALGRPLAVLWGAGDPAQTRPLSPKSRLLGGFDLPCHPCLEHACPRSGPGHRSAVAERECLRTVSPGRVEEVVFDLLGADGCGAGGEVARDAAPRRAGVRGGASAESNAHGGEGGG